jgi:hypothetical protein
MTFVRSLGRRAGAQRGLLALVALVAALVTATLLGALGHVALAARAGLSDVLTTADPTDAAAQLGTPRSTHDPVAQVAAGEEVLADTLAGQPVTVHRSTRSTALTLRDGTDDGPQLVVAADPGLADRVEVTDGALPQASGGDEVVPVTLPAQVAEVLDVQVGDRLELAGASRSAAPLLARVDAVWEPVDARDPAWFDGLDGTVWLDEADLDRVPAESRVRWTVVPDADRLLPQDVPALRAALETSLTALQADEAVDELGVVLTDGLATTLDRTDATLRTVRAVSWPAEVLVALTGLVVLAQLAVLLAEVRRGELVLLRSRGLSRRLLVGGAALEGGVVGLLGSLLGAAGALAALAATGVGGHGIGGVLALGIGTLVVVTCAVALVLAGAVLLQVRRPLGATRADGPLRGSALLGGGVLAVAAGAVAVWRLLDLGTPLVDGAGGATVDATAAAAPALGLLAVAVVLALATAPLSRLLGRRAARRPGLAVLPVHEIGRRPTAHATSAALVGLAAATAVLVAVLLGSWTGARQTQAAVHAGGDLRITARPADAPAALEIARSADDGLVVPVDVRAVVLGETAAELVAVPTEAWPRLHTADADDAAVLRAPEATSTGSAVPAVLTHDLAGSLALSVGDQVRVQAPGREVTVEVAGLVDAVPGSGDPAALLVDLTDWTGPEEPSAVERPREVWAWPTGDGIPAALAEAGLEVTVTTTDPAAAPLLDPALTAFRLAGWATVALAAGGLLAAARASSRARRSEIGMLRGLGVGGDVQARLRVSEQVRVLLPAVLLGAAAGAGLSALVVAPLVGALDGAAVSLPVPFAVDLPDLLVRIGILLLAGAAVTAGVAHDSRGRARTASPREVIP